MNLVQEIEYLLAVSQPRCLFLHFFPSPVFAPGCVLRARAAVAPFPPPPRGCAPSWVEAPSVHSQVLQGNGVRAVGERKQSGRNRSAGEDVEKSGPLCCWWGRERGQRCGHQCGEDSGLQRLTLESPDDPALPLPGVHPKELKARPGTDTCTLTLMAALIHCSQDMETTPATDRGWVRGCSTPLMGCPSALERKGTWTRAARGVSLEDAELDRTSRSHTGGRVACNGSPVRSSAQGGPQRQ